MISLPSYPDSTSPTVTVVVPTYNRADILGETLDSIAAQTFTDWECIVVDDGSTDRTSEVVARYCARDERFRCVRQENSSAARARNRGLSMARGDFVCFLDSDDLFAADRLEWQVRALRDDPQAVLVYGDTFRFRDGDLDKGKVYLQELEDKPSGWAFERLISCSSMFSPLLRTQTIRELGGFDTSLKYAEDWDMWLSLSKQGTLVFRPRIATYYRVHEGNKSLANTLKHYRSAAFVIRKQLRDLPWRKRIDLYRKAFRYLRSGYSPRLRKQARELVHSGNWREAREVFLTLVRLDPTQLRRRWVLANVLWAVFVPERVKPPWLASR